MINRAALEELKVIMPSKERYNNILERYIKLSEELIEVIVDSAHTRDSVILEAKAHPLKSSSAQIGGDEVARLAEVLEKMGKEKIWDQIDDIINRLKIEHIELVKLLRQEIES